MHSSSSSEKYESSGSNTISSKNEKSRTGTGKRGRRTSSPTDSDDEDPFHFDNVISSSPTKRETQDDNPNRALSSSFLRRASIVPVDPNAEPAPHRFSLLRERASEETIFVQEICDAEGRRWSLRVPASGLPEDMVQMLEELEKLAVELGQALPKIVVTCSAESLSMRRMERDAATANSLELLRPPPAVGDESSVRYDVGTGLSLAKEKDSIIIPERTNTEGPGARLSEPFCIAAPGSSEKSLTCIHLPEVSRFRLERFLSRRFSSAYDLISARTRVPVRRLNFFNLTTHSRLSQKARTDDPMRTPTRLLLGTQRTPTNEQHRQASNNAALNEGRTGI